MEKFWNFFDVPDILENCREKKLLKNEIFSFDNLQQELKSSSLKKCEFKKMLVIYKKCYKFYEKCY